ncbi:MAG: hypothetical protein WKF84_05725 [Pyrinomonadaceae bacterium]
MSHLELKSEEATGTSPSDAALDDQSKSTKTLSEQRTMLRLAREIKKLPGDSAMIALEMSAAIAADQFARWRGILAKRARSGKRAVESGGDACMGGDGPEARDGRC